VSAAPSVASAYGGVSRGPTWLLRRAAVYGALILLSAIFLIPLAWMVTTSFKQQGQVFANPPVWLPDPWMIENYPEAARRAPLWLWLRNTVAITIVATVGNVLVSSMVGFGFARIRFPGRGPLFILLLATMMLPAQVTLIPRFLLFKNLGWTDTFLPLILPSWFGGGAYFVFLVRQYYLTLPLDLDEAARIDGASNWRVWWNIIMPLSYPVLVAIGIFAFVAHWNEFLEALIFLNSESLKTLSLGLRAFLAPTDASWHITMAASMWLVVPMMLVFFLGQRYFIKGVAMTGIAGR
jgi:multiple sugar transport system permease protein